jgi:hypothetical protein
VGNIRGSVGRVRAGGGDGGGWSDSLCTKRITFISGKPRVAPNCNQFFVFLFFSRTHRSPSASLSPPPILSAVHSVPFLLVPFRTDPCLRRAGPCFVRSLARSLARSFVRSFVRSLIRSGWLAGVTPCNRNLHPGSYYLHFNSARLSLPPSLPPPPPLPNGGYKHKYEFKGPRATMYPLTSPALVTPSY